VSERVLLYTVYVSFSYVVILEHCRLVVVASMAIDIIIFRATFLSSCTFTSRWCDYIDQCSHCISSIQ